MPALRAGGQVGRLLLVAVLSAASGGARFGTGPEPPPLEEQPPAPPHPALIFDLQPTSGPTQGGTVITLSGAHLEPHDGSTVPVCRFGFENLLQRGTYSGHAAHGLVECIAPAANVGYEVAVELSLDGGATFTAHGFRFQYYHEAQVYSVSPSSGPAAGGTNVTVTGYNFGHEKPRRLQCAFGWRRVPATVVDFEHLRCCLLYTSPSPRDS